MSKLAEKIKKAREQRVEVGGFVFIVRRPTDVEMIELRGNGSVTRLFPFIVGWEGVKELDLIPGGDPHPLEFDHAACVEWVSDKPDLFGPIVSKILASYQEHASALESSAKNS